MKKLFTFVLAAVMMFAVSTSVFADFVSSPSNVAAPEIVDVSSSNPDWNGKMVVTPYGDRDSLPDALQTTMAEAYGSIKNASDLTVLNAGLAELAENKGVPTKSLAVSALFDVHSTTEVNGTITLKLQQTEALKNFVALIHFTDGKWEIVKGATVKGDVITFSSDSFSPFAIVVATEIPGPPPTGVNFIGLVAICTGLFAAAGVCLFVAVKKKRTNA